MAEHNILFSLPEVEMKRVDASLIIKKDAFKLGEMKISRGGIDYYPRGRKVNAIKLTWTQLDKILQKYEKGEIKL
jgi:hypothetical protein